MCDVGTIEKATLQLRKVTFVRALLTALTDAIDCPGLSAQLHMRTLLPPGETNDYSFESCRKLQLSLLKWRFRPENLATKRSKIVVAYPRMADF